MMTTKDLSVKDAGFSLVEAIIAVLVFIIGIAAVTNLFLMSATANSTANTQTATAAIASEVLDGLRAYPINTLTPGPIPAVPLTPTAADAAACQEPAANCVTPGNYSLQRIVPGVGIIYAKWNIVTVPPVGGVGDSLLFITVRAQTRATVVGERGSAEFTTFRY